METTLRERGANTLSEADRFLEFKNILMASDYCWLEKLYGQCSGQMREEITKIEAELNRLKGPGVRTELGTLAERIDCIVSELVYRLMILHFTIDSEKNRKQMLDCPAADSDARRERSSSETEV